MFNPAMYESMKHMMNGNMMKQSAEMMSKMSDEQLKSFGSMAGMNLDPQLLRNASSSMAQMDESTLENLKNSRSFPPGPVNQASPAVSPPSSKALEFKTRGTDKFRSGDFKEASVLYQKGIEEIEKEGLNASNKELEVSLRMNLVACLAKEEKYEEIIEQCKSTLILEKNIKAYYRYGQALFKLGKEEKSLEYLEKAREISPNDENILNLYEDVKKSVSLKKRESKEDLQNNYDKPAEKIGNPETQESEKDLEKPVEKPVIVDKPKNRGVDLDLTPKVSEKKPKKPEKITEKIPEKITEKVEANEPPKQNPVANDLKLPNLSQEQMTKGLEDLRNMSPDMIKQMANQLKSMDPRLMQEVFKSQGINMPPEQIAKMADMLTPETIQMMTRTMPNQPVNQDHPGSQTSAQPQMPRISDIAALLSNPEMLKMASSMLAQQFGKKPEELEGVVKCIGVFLRILGKFITIYNIFMSGNRKYFSLAVVTLGISYWWGFI